uniref:Uncharacterized protein n=1 Tax=Mycena chlorophos TaxID=658473 RepID=A0ABQ0LCT3_MYCCL|nr:predicted protein [Mycena chlorophos]
MEIFDVDAEDLAQRAAAEAMECSEDSDDNFESDREDDASVTGSAPAFSPPSLGVGSKRKWADLIAHPPPAPLPTAGAGPSHNQSPPPSLVPAVAEKDRQRTRRRKKRHAKREDEQAATGCTTKLHCATRTAAATRTAVSFDLDSEVAREPTAASGWVCLSDATLDGRREKASRELNKQPTLVPKSVKPTLQEVLELGFTYDAWDGRGQVVYVDRQGREIAVLCGQPRDDKWDADVAEAGAVLMKELSPQLSSLDSNLPSAAPKKKKRKKKAKRSARRGDHRAETIGVGMGNGRTEPGSFRNGDGDAAVLERLLSAPPFTRIAGFCKSILLNFAPRLHEYYEQTMDAIFERYPWLRRIFDRRVSVFPSCTFNFGPQTVTIPHLDLLNLAWGWCFITALGWFDPDLGGHLILWDLKRIVRFPPGSSIAIPSALLRHSNAAIQEAETRYSFTQFAAGGLFRFAQNGFALNESVRARLARMSAKERAEWAAAEAARFSEGLKMYNVHKID